jgi:hypothetical protein
MILKYKTNQILLELLLYLDVIFTLNKNKKIALRLSQA